MAFIEVLHNNLMAAMMNDMDNRIRNKLICK